MQVARDSISTSQVPCSDAQSRQLRRQLSCTAAHVAYKAPGELEQEGHTRRAGLRAVSSVHNALRQDEQRVVLRGCRGNAGVQVATCSRSQFSRELRLPAGAPCRPALVLLLQALCGT